MLHTTSSHLDSPLVHRGDSIRCPSQRTCLNVTIAGRGIIPPARANHSAFSAPPPATMQSLSNPWQARQLLGLGTWNLELGTFELARDASEPKTFYVRTSWTSFPQISPVGRAISLISSTSTRIGRTKAARALAWAFSRAFPADRFPAQVLHRGYCKVVRFQLPSKTKVHSAENESRGDSRAELSGKH
jgi:hypothetical protein